MANYIRYANQGATRNRPLDPRLIDALGFLDDMGVTAEVFSGGQPATGLGRIGSHRHDNGESGDMNFFMGDRKLDWANPDDVPIFQKIVSQAKERGVTGFGAGPGYMSPGSMHVGYGTPAIWGAKNSSANAPEWLRSAYNGTTLNSMPVQVASGQPAPQLPDAMEVKSHPIAGVPEDVAAKEVGVFDKIASGVDKIGPVIFGGQENADKLKGLFGAGADPKSPMMAGLGMVKDAVKRKDPEKEQFIPSSGALNPSADAGRMASAQQLMATILAARSKNRGRGLTLGGMA